MLQLKCTLGHIMALAPLLDAGNVVIDLQATFPGEKVSPHEKVIECSDTDKSEKLSDRLCDYSLFQIESLHCFVDIVQETEKIIHTVGWVVVGG